MQWEQDVVDALKKREVEFIAYLPDSIIDGLIHKIKQDEEFTTVRVAREEEAVSLLSGVWLGGNKGALICQSSGLANCFNALSSHAKPANLPFLGLVTKRGDLGEHNKAQVPAGYGLPKMLEGIGIRYHQLEDQNEAGRRVKMAAETCFSTQEPYVMMLERQLTGEKNE